MADSVEIDVEQEIVLWRRKLNGSGTLLPDEVEELQGHLRDEMDTLVNSGLAVDEALFVAVRRIGRTSALSSEYFKVNGGRLWRQLFGTASKTPASNRLEIWVAIACALGAALSSQIPYIFGFTYSGDTPQLLVREASFYLFPFLVTYVVYKRRLEMKYVVAPAVAVIAAFAIMNFYPFQDSADTLLLSASHLFLLLWTYPFFFES